MVLRVYLYLLSYLEKKEFSISVDVTFEAGIFKPLTSKVYASSKSDTRFINARRLKTTQNIVAIDRTI